jgi:ribonuclease HI
VVLLHEDGSRRELSGGEEDTTNNRMELTAAIKALSALDGSWQVTLITDSQYLRQGISTWISRWKAEGWKTKDRGDVKNRDLWESLAAEIDRHEMTWSWTRGHAGDRWNERADKLASAAIPRGPLPLDETDAVHLFAAVAFSGKKNRGGWGVVLRFGEHSKELSGREDNTSANRMHLRSAIAGLEALKRRSKVHLYTTSDYLADGATKWVENWKRRGWKTREGKAVSHRDLWQLLDRLTQQHVVHWHTIPRDDRTPEGDQAKSLAKEAMTTDP